MEKLVISKQNVIQWHLCNMFEYVSFIILFMYSPTFYTTVFLKLPVPCVPRSVKHVPMRVEWV